MKKAFLLVAFSLMGFSLNNCGQEESGVPSRTPPRILQMNRMGDSIRFASNSEFQWIVDFRFFSDSAQILANRSDVDEYYAGTGGLFAYSALDGRYVERPLNGTPDRFIALDSLGGKVYLLKYSSICEMQSGKDSCKTLPKDTVINRPRSFHRLFTVNADTFMVVDDQSGVINGSFRLFRVQGWKEITERVGEFTHFDYSESTFYYLRSELYSAPWNSILSSDQRTTLTPIPESTSIGMYNLVKFHVIDEVVYVQGMHKTVYPYYMSLAKRPGDSVWKKLYTDSSTRIGEYYPRANLFLYFPFGYNFTDAGKYVLIYNTRVLRVIRKADFKVVELQIQPKVIGSKWILKGDKLFTNGYRSLYFVEMETINSFFE